MKHLTDTVSLFERRDWRARSWRDFTPQNLNGEAFIHHGAEHNAEQLDHFEEQAAAMRQTQAFHMDTRGWDDIAYHFVVFQAYGNIPYARIFEGRPVTHVPAAQARHNTGTLAICVFGNFENEDSVKRNTRHAIEVLLNQFPALKTVGGHRDAPGQSTECPGDTLYAQIPTIASAAGLQVYQS